MTKDLHEYSKQVEVDNTKKLESQRKHIEELEKEFQLVIEQEATTRALLVAIQQKVQHQQASRNRKRDITNKKEFNKGWKAKVVSQLKSAQTAVTEAQSVQERLKRSVSCILCSKWTMDPVVRTRCPLLVLCWFPSAHQPELCRSSFLAATYTAQSAVQRKVER